MKKVYYLLALSLLLSVFIFSVKATTHESLYGEQNQMVALTTDFSLLTFPNLVPSFPGNGKGDPGWVITPGMETNMSVYVTSATIEGVPVQYGKVAAFDSITNQCRAVESFFEIGGAYQVILTVGFNSEEADNPFYYRVWDSIADIVYEVNERGIMVPDDFQIIDLTLIPPPPYIKGTVINELTGQPLEDVEISATPVNKSVTKGAPGWVIIPGMETNMSIWVTSASLNGVPMQYGKVAAFDALTNQCRAVENFWDGGGGIGQVILTVGFNSEETGNDFYYMVWDSISDQIYDVIETGIYTPDDFYIIDLTLVPAPEPLITYTATDGSYVFPNIPDGEYVICTGKTASTPGYIDECAPGSYTTPPAAVVDFALLPLCQNSPTSDAGPDATICESSILQLSGNAQYQSGVLWTTSGNGTFDNPNLLNPVYTPGTNDINQGSVILTLLVNPIEPCTQQSLDAMVLTLQWEPVVNAGIDGAVCQGNTHQLSGSAQNHISVVWTTSGTGTFSNTSNLNAIYTPSQADITAGSVTLTLTATAISPCTIAKSDSKILVIQKNPIANAGLDETICQGSTVQLNGTAQNQGTVLWSTSGTGTFNNQNLLNPVYTPSAADIAAGQVVLTINALAISPCWMNYTDSKILVIRKNPVVDAGVDKTICQGNTTQLSATAQFQNSVLWTTSGTGTFSSATSLTPVYTPSTGDINAGTVTLTVTAYAMMPCVSNPSDFLILTIQKSPVTNAGADATICEGFTHQLSGTVQYQSSSLWTTSGTGTFSNPGILNPVYTPSTADINAGSVTITLTGSAISPCVTAVTDALLLTIQKLPNANAGSDATICEGETKQLSGAAVNYSSVLWSSSGTGTFSNPAILNPIYTPSSGDINAGSVTLTLTASAASPCVGVSTDVLVLTFQKLPTANAGSDATICQGSTHQLAGTAQFQNNVLWTTSGTGTFNNPASLNPVYTPSTGDINAGTVTLTLTASAISPCTVASSDAMILTIQKLPTANAGSDATICQGNTHQLAGTAQNQNSVLWTTSGTGTFNNPASLTPIYTPSSGDINAGTVTLTLTASAISPCTVASSDAKILTIQKLPTANAGSDASICENNTVQLAGSAQNQNSVLWTTSGNGTFNNPGILSPVYTPGSGDILAGSVTLTITANAISPCTISATDNMVITIQKLPVVNAGNDDEICAGDDVLLNGTGSNYSSVLWSTSGDGIFGSPTNLSTTYNPGTGDITNGSVNLTLTGSAVSPCITSVSNSMVLTIHPLPVVTFSQIDTLCVNWPPYQLTEGSPAGGVYSGPFVVNGWFDPGQAGVGSFVLTYTYTDGFGCENSANSTVVVDACTSIIEQSSTSVLIVPNPGNGYFTLQLAGNAGKEYDLKIFTVSGKLVMESEVMLNDENKVYIDLTSQPQGLYFLTLKNGDNQVINRKLVISR